MPGSRGKCRIIKCSILVHSSQYQQYCTDFKRFSYLNRQFNLEVWHFYNIFTFLRWFCALFTMLRHWASVACVVWRCWGASTSQSEQHVCDCSNSEWYWDIVTDAWSDSATWPCWLWHSQRRLHIQLHPEAKKYWHRQLPIPRPTASTKHWN